MIRAERWRRRPLVLALEVGGEREGEVGQREGLEPHEPGPVIFTKKIESRRTACS